MTIWTLVIGLISWACLAGPVLQAQEPPPDAAPLVVEEEVIDSALAEVTADDPRRGESYPGQSLVEKLRKGGITIVFLILLSISGLAYTIERISNLKRANVIPDGLVEEVEKAWVAGDFEKAESICQASDSTAGRILETFVHYRDFPPSELHPIASDIAGRDLKRHLQRAYPLAVVGAVAPLLGLMGTVFGMIESFEIVAVAGSLGDASILADGISKALVTTAVGLVIAVPFLLLYHYFKTRTTLFAVDLEEQINEFTKRVFLERSKRDLIEPKPRGGLSDAG